MFGKNPYENEDSIEIQDFSNDDEDNVKETFLETDEELEEEEEETVKKEPVYRRVKQEVIIVAGALLALLLVLAIIALVYGANKNKAYNDLRADYEAYISKATANETDLKKQISDLQKQLTEATTPKVEEVTSTGDSYIITAERGLGVRPNPGETISFANYDKLPSDIQQMCDHSGDTVYLYYNSVVKVYEIKSASGASWGKIADGAWICLDYAKKQ